MDGIEAVEDTMGVSGVTEGRVDELAAYIRQIELEFTREADELLEKFNLSYLRVRS